MHIVTSGSSGLVTCRRRFVILPTQEPAPVNGDLRLFRKRWWGSWTVGGSVLLTMLAVLFLPNASSGGPSILRVAFGTTVTVLPVLLLCYAPWTFFNIGRLLGLLTFLGTIAYLVDEVRRGRYMTQGSENQSAFNAVHALLMFGLPGLWVALLRRPRVCPYDERGRPRPFEVERTFRVRPTESESAARKTGKGEPLQTVRFDYAGSSRIEFLDAKHPDLMRVTLPMDGTGDAVWADWQRRLAEAGLHCEVVQEQPGTRSFKDSVVQSVQKRHWFGRRVKPHAQADEPRAPVGA